MTAEIVLIAQLKNIQTKEKAFRELISIYKERLYWHIRKIVISHDDTDDVLQNTFMKIYISERKFALNLFKNMVKKGNTRNDFIA